MSRVVELRSDTFTRPTPEMRRAMYEAQVGDDVWNEDPTVHRLEERAAQLLGKEAALFVTSGTQGNLIGLLAQVRPGSEVLLGSDSHVFNNESAGAAVVGGLQLRTLPNGPRGTIDPALIEDAIRPDDLHQPPTGALVLENTHNRCGGGVQTVAEVNAMAAVARHHHIPVHMDGARLFNAAVALDVPASAIVENIDSVTFCLSKGLGAPVGSILCGTRAFIDAARRWRKILGGGMRQAGVLAAAGLVALESGIDRLHEDHAAARMLADGLAEMSGIEIDPSSVQSNIVNFDVARLPVSPAQFIAELDSHGVKLAANKGSAMRAVTSFEVNLDDIVYAIGVIAGVARVPVPALA